MSSIGHIGERLLDGIRNTCHLAAVVWTLLRLAATPHYWVRTVRAVLVRQILFTGVEALSFVSLVAFLTGVAVVVQIQDFITNLGQRAFLGPILVTVIVRELAPLLVNFIVIGRSGAAMATELANMKVMREINILEAQGVDPLTYLAMPRVLAMAVSIFGLTMAFILISFVSGYLSGFLMGSGDAPFLFANSVLIGLHSKDVYNLLTKTLLTGLLTGTICVIEGLSVGGSITEVPQAATRAVVRSIKALFLISAVVSVLTYF
ncbi:MAG: ABC transporter permease [Lentisphaerae bacterium]|nr:ABC transporter permease [Lentisphaerota bacterium]